jgi:hypothetical protein
MVLSDIHHFLQVRLESAGSIQSKCVFDEGYLVGDSLVGIKLRQRDYEYIQETVFF